MITYPIETTIIYAAEKNATSPLLKDPLTKKQKKFYEKLESIEDYKIKMNELELKEIELDFNELESTLL